MKKSVIVKISILFLLSAVVILGFRVTNQQNQLQEYKLETAEIDALLTGGNAALGYSCGVLTQNRAEQLLGGSSELKRVFGQGPAKTVQVAKPPQEKLFWSDSCRYEDETNNGRYIEMYVTTFQTSEDATKAFPDFIQVVSDVEELSSEGYGQQLLYDGGAYYMLKDNKVIQTAASNGIPNELESFSRKVFENIYGNL